MARQKAETGDLLKLSLFSILLKFWADWKLYPFLGQIQL